MNKRISTPAALLLAAVAIVLLANAALLAEAAWNRSAVTAQLTLSERELMRLPAGAREEDRRLRVRLLWRVAGATAGTQRAYYPWSREITWLDAAGIDALGFDSARLLRTPAGQAQRRRLWLALELDGAARREVLTAARRELDGIAAHVAAADASAADSDALRHARNRWEEERDRASRLFLIDVARDVQALRARHADAGDALLIVPGSVSATRITGAGGAARLRVSVERLEAGVIHVPRRLHAALPAAAPDVRPRWALDIAWGRRFRPWITGVAAGSAPPRD